MKVKKLTPLIFLAIFLIANVASASNVRTTGFTTYISNGSSLGFQNGNRYVLLTVSNGVLNSSFNSVYLSSGGGLYRFTANESVTLLITFNVTNCKVQGDSGNDYRMIQSGSSFHIVTNDLVLIQWDITVTPWLPLLFIFGVLGLLTVFTGSLYGVSEIKKGNYYNGFRMSILLICIGIAFVIAWLWSA